MNCDVCHKPLLRSGNDKLYYCPMQVSWSERLRRNLQYHHMFVGTDKKGTVIHKMITVPPYIFEIDFKTKITKVKKIISFAAKTLIDTPVKLDENHEEKEVVEIKAILNLPWDDIDKVDQKIKVYNLFS